jgi:hypothetical protein
MPIQVQCSCGRKLKARDEFGGARGECPFCGSKLQIPAAASSESSGSGTAAGVGRAGEAEEAIEIKEFLDPPSWMPPRGQGVKSLRMMWEALLDPRSIQWMLMIGGGLCVLGLVIWLASLGLFENKLVLAVALGIGSLLVLGAGWYLALRTKHTVAGQAMTSLGCVVCPLNLWYYHAQNLVTVEQHLWVGGVICSLICVATVYVLRDPLFMYAIEGGVTLTAMLLLGDLGYLSDTTWLSLFFLAMGLLSIHAERAFPPAENAVFTRRRFGMPLFWSGQVQTAIALVMLLATQLLAWLLSPAQAFLNTHWEGNTLSESSLLAGALWLGGTYAFLYSDLIVRRKGVYTHLAALCLILAEITLIGLTQHAEFVIAALAITALAANLSVRQFDGRMQTLDRAVKPLALGLGALPLLMGIALHIRATSQLPIIETLHWTYATNWWFVVAMLIVAACSRASAEICRPREPRLSAAYLFFSAAGLIVAAAGLLRMLGIFDWTMQALWLMLIPIGYLTAAGIGRGSTVELPLAWVAQTATAVILAGGIVSGLDVVESVLQPVAHQMINMRLGLVFSEAAFFYSLAAFVRRRSANVYLAAAAVCGAMWQFLKYWDVGGAYHTIFFAALGLVMLAAARWRGIELVSIYGVGGQRTASPRGRGLALFQSGNAVLALALASAFFQGLMYLAARALARSGSPDAIASRRMDWLDLSSLLLAAAASIVGAFLVPSSGLRRMYVTMTVVLSAVAFVTLNLLIHLSGWQKFEIFCLVIGTIMIATGYVRRFRETPGTPTDDVTIGLWLGSLLTAVPLLVAVFYHRFVGSGPSLPDELALLTMTVLMLVTGMSWQVKSTTLSGGATLVLYLILMVVSLAYHPQVAVGVYMAIVGGLVFAFGVALSIYRDKLAALPEQIAARQGVFRVIDWR